MWPALIGAGANVVSSLLAGGKKAEAQAVEQQSLQEEIDNAKRRLANKQVTNVTERVADLTR